MGRLRAWRSAFLAKIESVAGRPEMSPNMETGFRELFVEGPLDRSAAPPPATASAPAAASHNHRRNPYEAPEVRTEREREEFLDAISELTQAQYTDNVESLADSVQLLRDGLARVLATLPGTDIDAADLRVYVECMVENLARIIKWRVELLTILRGYIGEHCPSGLAAKLLQEGVPARFRRRYQGLMAGCTSDEHVWQIGEPRCDCGRVVVRAAPATP